MDTDTFLTASYARTRASAAVAAGTGTGASSQPLTLPSAEALAAARASLPAPGAEEAQLARGLGAEATMAQLTDTVAAALDGHNRGGRYYGFVTGSALPVAEAADNLVSAFDCNVQVHLPGQSVATDVEDAALRLLLRLLRLDEGGEEQKTWAGRTFTTGATASNVLGLACGRGAVVGARLPPEARDAGVGELGLLEACRVAGIAAIQVLTSAGHSSLSKAASVVGLGRGAVREVGTDDEPWRLDLDAVERELGRDDGVASIIAVSAAEVNTGRFATAGLEDMRRLRALADRYQAWIHVDGAFGVFARALPDTAEFARLRETAAGLELADSITVDGHKLLNVPYDAGIFFTRESATLHAVFQNPNAAYLSSGSDTPSIPSPLNIGLENSRRFRALPAYAVLVSEGRPGVEAMLARMVRLARGVAAALARDPGLRDAYELLPVGSGGGSVEDTHVIILFRARDDGLNAALVSTIQGSREWYVSGTTWEGRLACRMAVSSWRVNVDEDLAFVTGSLAKIAQDWRDGIR
ncbi:PLP-dependent transferase [Hypoxylon sp. FL1284]|nr:PLP-dependent transferase [Hypoxylon sp. FL1284]